MSKELETIKALIIQCPNEGIVKDLKSIEKELKAFEIIKEHFKIAKPVGVSIEKNTVGVGGLIQIKDLTIEDYSSLKEELL